MEAEEIMKELCREGGNIAAGVQDVLGVVRYSYTYFRQQRFGVAHRYNEQVERARHEAGLAPTGSQDAPRSGRLRSECGSSPETAPVVKSEAGGERTRIGMRKHGVGENCTHSVHLVHLATIKYVLKMSGAVSGSFVLFS